MNREYSKSTRVLYKGESGMQMQADFAGHTEVNLIGNGDILAIEDSRQRMLVPIARLIAVFMLATEE